jgi:hypothetical protein
MILVLDVECTRWLVHDGGCALADVVVSYMEIALD